MKYEPPTIDRSILIKTLEHQYALQIDRLDFVPLGEVACSYIVHAQNSEHYFLKLYTDTRAGRLFSARLDFYLPLCRRLKEEGVVERLPCAVATVHGELKIQLSSGDTLVLFDFIAGANVGCEAPMPDELFAQLGALFGRLHARGVACVNDQSRAETYEVPFADGMKKAFADFSSVDQRARPGRVALRQLLQPREAEVLGYLERLLELQKAVRLLDVPHVLCHTDLHGDNLIADTEGYLHALDWEGVLLAPVEHDLFMYIGDERFVEVFLPAYERECGKLQLRRSVLAFYFYRRLLEDLADWFLRILYEEQTDAQDQSDLQYMREDCVEVWSFLPTSVQKVEEKLKAKGIDLFI